jgi:electron transfer flavoprotein alpha/beta subunit
MRLLVCFKVTPDYEALREPDWAAAVEGGPRTRYVRRVLNCFDESALELALRLREEAGPGDVELGALSVGGHEADAALATLLALGYGRAARIEPGAQLDYAPQATAALLAASARRDAADVLLLGCRCGPADSGTVPALVAEELGWPTLNQVTEIAPLEGARLRVTCATAGSLLRVTVTPPCVLAVGNALVSHLRVPTLRDRLAARDRHPDVLAPADVGVDLAAVLRDAPAALESLERVERRRAGAVVAAGTPRELARALLDACPDELWGPA